MSSVVIAGDTSGSVTISAPAVAGTPTLTLPTTSGTVVATSGGYVPTSQLGSGSASSSTYLRGDQSWATISSGGMTLLGTITTTSGSTQTLSGLTLTNYKQLYCVLSGVIMSTTGNLTYTSSALRCTNNLGSTSSVYATVTQDLTCGAFITYGNENTTDPTYTGAGIAYLDYSINVHAIVGRSNLTTSSTSVSFGCSAGNFTAGSITVYGVA